MLHFVYGSDLGKMPALQDSMFRDRTTQFRDRLGWDISVDHNGWETDSYDTLNPFYVIWEPCPGVHGGSMRFLPTTGPTLAKDHFSHLEGATITSPYIWECSRFCLSPDADSRASKALAAGGAHLMHRYGLDHYTGIFDPRMLRVYRMIGIMPEILDIHRNAGQDIGIGLWHYDATNHATLLDRASLTHAQVDAWIVRGELTRNAFPKLIKSHFFSGPATMLAIGSGNDRPDTHTFQ